MRRLPIVLLAAALLGGGAATQDAARSEMRPPVQIVREGDIGRTVEVESGKAVELLLPENRSTGFRWFVTADGAPTCVVDRDEFLQPPQRIPGAPGEHVWQFRGVQIGECRVELAYRRPWDEARPPERVFQFHIRVTR